MQFIAFLSSVTYKFTMVTEQLPSGGCISRSRETIVSIIGETIASIAEIMIS